MCFVECVSWSATSGCLKNGFANLVDRETIYDAQMTVFDGG